MNTCFTGDCREVMKNPKFSRYWAMPSHNTFSIPEIGLFVKKYLIKSKTSIDPFARNKRLATYTNDLNPNTQAEYHMEAKDFLAMLDNKGIRADLILFDPPYSTRQLKECYDNIDKKLSFEQTQAPHSEWRKAINKICSPDAIVLSFGWSTVGMGDKYGFEIEEIMLVCHGGMHNDTICMAERKKRTQQAGLGI